MFETAANFSVGNARAMMWFSQLAYETGKPATIAAVAPGWGCWIGIMGRWLGKAERSGLVRRFGRSLKGGSTVHGVFAPVMRS